MSVYKEIKEKIESQKGNISEKEFRFFQFQRLVRISQVIENDLKDCKFCNDQIYEISPMLDDIKKLTEDLSSRTALDRRSENLVKHLRKEHQFYLPYYFSYTYSFIGMLVGGLIGVILAYSILFDSKIIAIAGFWFIGLFIGRIFGIFQDRKQKKLEKQL